MGHPASRRSGRERSAPSAWWVESPVHHAPGAESCEPSLGLQQRGAVRQQTASCPPTAGAACGNAQILLESRSTSSQIPAWAASFLNASGALSADMARALAECAAATAAATAATAAASTATAALTRPVQAAGSGSALPPAPFPYSVSEGPGSRHDAVPTQQGVDHAAAQVGTGLHGPLSLQQQEPWMVERGRPNDDHAVSCEGRGPEDEVQGGDEFPQDHSMQREPQQERQCGLLSESAAGGLEPTNNLPVAGQPGSRKPTDPQPGPVPQQQPPVSGIRPFDRPAVPSNCGLVQALYNQASRTVRAVDAAYIEVARVRGHVIQPAIETDHGTGREAGPFQCVLNTAASSTEPRLVATGTGRGNTRAIAKLSAFASMFQDLLSKESTRATCPITVENIHLHPVTWLPRLGVFQNAALTAGCPRARKRLKGLQANNAPIDPVSYLNCYSKSAIGYEMIYMTSQEGTWMRQLFQTKVTCWGKVANKGHKKALWTATSNFFASAKDSKQHAAASGMEILDQATAAAGEVVDDISDSEMVGGCTLALGVQGRPAAGWPKRSPEHVVSQMSKPDLLKRRQQLARDPRVVVLDTQTIPQLLQLQASYTGPHADRMDAHNPLRCPFYLCRVRMEMELRVAQQWPNNRAVKPWSRTA
ncbi:MAG: hypothetical protein WDW36_006692 [Sanguina aurantia]